MLFFGFRSRKLLAIRLGLVAVLLIVTFAFHVHGTGLVVLRLVRLALLIGLVVGARVLSGRRRNREFEGSSGRSVDR